MGIVTANYAMFNKEVVLIVDGQEIEVNSYQPDVQGVLDENKIEYDSNYVISEDLDASLEDGMEIEVKQIEKKTIRETEEIPYDTIIKKDKTLLKGKTKVSGGFRSKNGAIRFGKIMSIIKTAKLRKMNPFECIKAIFEDKVLFA